MSAAPPPPLATDRSIREAYAADVSGLTLVPDAVARPGTEQEVQEILARATMDRVPVTPAGGQTSTTGASISDRGILLSMRAMDRIVDIDAAKRRAIVQPGVLLGALNKAAAAHGLLFAPDPTSLDDVTLGGCVACNASGARSLMYGATRPHVRSARVALANGDIVQVGRSGLDKNTAGYAFAQDPLDLFIGSEGTLGVIVEAELALIPLPERVVGLGIPCPDETSALTLVIAIRDSTLRPRCIEYFDATALDIARTHRGGTWAAGAGAFLYVEDVSGRDLDDWIALAEKHEARVEDILVFEGDAALREARAMRHAIPATMIERGNANKPRGGRRVSTDWAVPYRLLGDAVRESRRLAGEAGITQPVVYGHAGNGHPHQNFVAHDAQELERIEAVVEATLRYVLSIGGTVAAEHGIGKLKRKWLPLQASPMQLGVMRAVKRELDPFGIMAPGNIL